MSLTPDNAFATAGSSHRYRRSMQVVQ